jgi:hypothetical protein
MRHKSIIVLLIVLVLSIVFVHGDIPEEYQGDFILDGEIAPFSLDSQTAISCKPSCSSNNVAIFNISVTATEFTVRVGATTTGACTTPNLVFKMSDATLNKYSIQGTAALIVDSQTVSLGNRCVLFDGANLIFDVLGGNDCLGDYVQASQCVYGSSVLAESFVVSTNTTGTLLPEGSVPEQSTDPNGNSDPPVQSSDADPRDDSNDASSTVVFILALVPFVMALLF